jgi:predicted DNA-binding protein with PD1-like motif
MKSTFAILTFLIITMPAFKACAQEYQDPTAKPPAGKAPGMKYKVVSANGDEKIYVIIFSHGDEILSGLTDFATKNSVTCAHFTAIGDASSAKFGWYDKTKKKFKVLNVGDAEITSLIGDIAVSNGKPVVHGHINLGTEDGIVHGGHLIEAYVGPTLEVFLTTSPTTLEKKVDPAFGAAVIQIE